MFDCSIGRFIQRDPTGLTRDNANPYEYVRCRPTAVLDPTGKDEWRRKRDWGPRLLDGRMPSYDIGIIHVLPPVPKGATQVWQVITCVRTIIDKNCKVTIERTHTIDIVNIGNRKEIKDQLSWIKRVDVCVAAEVCMHAIGFDDQKSKYEEDTNIKATERLAKEVLDKMGAPMGWFATSYLYVKKSNCKQCCGTNRFLISRLPEGERLTIAGVGSWSSEKG
jgi:hypothetical protein